MPIRIASIRVNRGGPLTHDFELDAGDLNLVFGHNESGKTYVVESMISFLFRKGLQMRPWKFLGRVVVEGLGPEPVSFTGTERNLEDYLDDASKGLPRDLSRLLVVRAGETKLTPDPDGVGRRLLSRLLSGEEMLNEIQDRIPKAVRPATVENGAIVGAKRQGKNKERLRLQDELGRLDHLLKKVRRDFTTGLIPPLERNKRDAEEKLGALLLAKRHCAFQLHGDIAGLEAAMSELPNETSCTELETDIGIYGTKTSDRAALQEQLGKLEDTNDDYFWVQKALGNYKDITATQEPKKARPLFLILAAISFAAATVMGLFGQKIGVAVTAAATSLFYWLYYSERSRALASVADGAELVKLKAEFRRRFGKELADMATIQSQVERLNKNFIRAEQLCDQLEKLDRDIAAQSGAITDRLQLYVEADLSPERWRSELLGLRNRRRQLDKEIGGTNSHLAALSLDESEYLKRNPGTKWDPERQPVLEDQIQGIQVNIHEEQRRLDELRDRIAQETELPGKTGWEELLSRLGKKREAVASNCRETTAEILAQTQLQAAIHEFREQETELIISRLGQDEFAGPLLAITGRYDHINLDNDDLVLRDQNHNVFALEQMSTGAQEQAWLALRLGFASLNMEGQAAFLILDDAFQHSDWKRRPNMVTEVIRLAESGWQVFYFSMDDHISGLFRAAAKKLQVNFVETDLGA